MGENGMWNRVVVVIELFMRVQATHFTDCLIFCYRCSSVRSLVFFDIMDFLIIAAITVIGIPTAYS